MFLCALYLYTWRVQSHVVAKLAPRDWAQMVGSRTRILCSQCKLLHLFHIFRLEVHCCVSWNRCAAAIRGVPEDWGGDYAGAAPFVSHLCFARAQSAQRVCGFAYFWGRREKTWRLAGRVRDGYVWISRTSIRASCCLPSYIGHRHRRMPEHLVAWTCLFFFSKRCA